MTQVSFTQLLFRQVSLFVLIPIVLIVSLSMLMAYRSESRLIDNAIHSQNKALASNINGKLTHLQFATMELSQNKGISEIAANILYSQYVDKTIQQTVQQSQLIEGAFLADQQGYILSGYPFNTLRNKSSVLQQFIQQKFAQTDMTPLPQLYFFAENTLQSNSVNTGNQGHYVFVSTIQRATQSLVNPMINSAILFVIIDINTLLDTHLIKTPDTSSEVNNHLHIPSISALTKPQKNNRQQVEQVLDFPVWQNNQSSPLHLVSNYKKSQYFTTFYTNAALTVLAIVIVFILAFCALKIWAKRLNSPIQEMVQLSHQIASGDYNIAKEVNRFIEFHQIHEALKSMASHIAKQMLDLTEARKKAESSDQLKSQFLANMSHEIRTPLNGVLGILQLLQQQSKNTQQDSMLSTALLSGKSLLRILNDILDFSKIEANQLDIEHIPFTPADVIQNSCALVSNQCLKKGLLLKVNVAQELKKQWSGDGFRLEQILHNLLSNAVKFSTAGEIKLTATLDNKSDKPFLNFSVTDNGIGIDKKHQASLFTPFKQADSTTTRHFGGTGLGLAICKRLVELMGGKMSVESEVGQGACFKFNILVESVADMPNKITEPHNKTAPNLNDKCILVAEDNVINQEIIKLMLEATGATICIVDNGKIVTERIFEILPDLILMDVQMPEMDGIDATMHLRTNNIKVPIIMLTANVANDDIASYLQAGANGVLGKPTDLAELYSTLKQYLN